MAEGKRQKAGGVPEGWREVRLGDVTSIYDGTHQTPKYVDEGVPFYSVEHVTGNQFQNTKFISEEVFAKETIRIERGDILMSRIGDVGTARMVDWDVRASFYVSLALIKNSSDFDSKFLESFINSSFFKSELWHRTIHTAFPLKINLGEISKCRILLPPLPEQQKIAAILSTWDDTLATLTDLLAAKRQQKRGLAEALLTGKKRLPGFEGEWEEKKLGEAALVTMGTSPSSSAYNNSGVGLPLIQGNADIKNRTAKPRVFTSEITKECQPDDIILSVRAPVGSVSRTHVKACIGRGVAAIHSKTNQDFLYFLLELKEDSWGSLMQGSTFESVTGKEVKDFPLSLPPLPEQKAIASILSTLDGEIASLEALKAKVQEQKRGLMDELLTGRVRVKVEEAC